MWSASQTDVRTFYRGLFLKPLNLGTGFDDPCIFSLSYKLATQMIFFFLQHGFAPRFLGVIEMKND